MQITSSILHLTPQKYARNINKKYTYSTPLSLGMGPTVANYDGLEGLTKIHNESNTYIHLFVALKSK